MLSEWGSVVSVMAYFLNGLSTDKHSLSWKYSISEFLPLKEIFPLSPVKR